MKFIDDPKWSKHERLINHEKWKIHCKLDELYSKHPCAVVASQCGTNERAIRSLSIRYHELDEGLGSEE